MRKKEHKKKVDRDDLPGIARYVQRRYELFAAEITADLRAMYPGSNITVSAPPYTETLRCLDYGFFNWFRNFPPQ